jgi:hypothetical protein
MRKVLWVVDDDESALVSAANYIRAQALCIRTTNAWLPGAIPALKSQGFDVYAWRWPTPQAIPSASDPGHWSAMNEAQFVKGLIDAGLDGYIVDPECDSQTDDSCWNKTSLATLANQFCDAIKIYGRQKNPNFLFGVTSGGQYPRSFPDIPWAAFAAHADALFPQCYWYADGESENGGTPQSAYTICMSIWKTIAPPTMNFVPMIGDITEVQASEIQSYQSIINSNNIAEIHFYAFVSGMSQANLDQLRALGTSGPLVS